jgi:hypothetical protein
MNDLIFVMCNLKLNDNQVKKQANDFGEVFDHLSSDDDWITEGEKYDGSSNFDLLGVIDSATQRKTVKKMKVMMKKILIMLGWSVMELKMI